MKRMCRCGKLIEYQIKLCDKCKSEEEQYQKQSQKEYDLFYRDSTSTGLYKSKEWEQIRLVVLDRYNNIDLYMYYVEGRIIPATTVHHIIELKDDWSKRLDIDNLFPTSPAGHSYIHKLYETSPSKKEQTIRLLLGMLDRYKKEFNLSIDKG